MKKINTLIKKDIFYPDIGNDSSPYEYITRTRHTSNYSKSIEASALKKRIIDDGKKRSMITVNQEAANSVKAIRLYGGTSIKSATKRIKSPLEAVRYQTP